MAAALLNRSRARSISDQKAIHMGVAAAEETVYILSNINVMLIRYKLRSSSYGDSWIKRVKQRGSANGSTNCGR